MSKIEEAAAIEPDTKLPVLERKAQTAEASALSAELDAPDADDGRLMILADIDPVDVVDKGKELSLELWVTDEDGNFRFDAGITYIGGVYKNNAAPGFSVNAAEYKGRKIQVRISSPKGETKAGATLEHVTAAKIEGK